LTAIVNKFGLKNSLPPSPEITNFAALLAGGLAYKPSIDAIDGWLVDRFKYLR
jgi:hypothetical protein